MAGVHFLCHVNIYFRLRYRVKHHQRDLVFLLVSIVLQHPQEVSTAVFLLDLADVQCATLRIKCSPVLKFSIEVLSRLTRFPLYNLLVSSIKPGE